MGLPVKLSDELVRTARTEASEADRSITAQIEHWARLGRSVERALRHDDALAIKRAAGDVVAAFPDAVDRESVMAILRRLATTTDRREIGRAVRRGRPVYESDGRGGIVRLETDGSRTRGLMQGRRFIPDANPSRPPSR